MPSLGTYYTNKFSAIDTVNLKAMHISEVQSLSKFLECLRNCAQEWDSRVDRSSKCFVVFFLSFPWLHYLFADFSNFSRCFSLFQKNVCLVAFGIQWKAMSRRNEVIERKTCLVLHLGISGRRKKEEDIDEENLHGKILLLTVKIFARLERM